MVEELENSGADGGELGLNLGSVVLNEDDMATERRLRSSTESSKAEVAELITRLSMNFTISSYRSACSASLAMYTLCSRLRFPGIAMAAVSVAVFLLFKIKLGILKLSRGLHNFRR
nr:hypothetical protein Iba_chr02aCG3800 [Ipomoea batatas]GMC62374.1 hypothetical protein Iba_chr02cCG3270 [Ipomoea batatas]GMC62375.1 hypothetical protein Iba_chr02cCG3280 [Ipomoea batatas]